MITWLSRFTANLTTKHPLLLLIIIALASVVPILNIHNLTVGTDLLDLIGSDTQQFKMIKDYLENTGYGNRLFTIIVTDEEADDTWEKVEILADRLKEQMDQSGYFHSVRCELEEEDMLGFVKLFAWNFPSYLPSGKRKELLDRLSPAGISSAIAQGKAGLVTPFSTLGPRYFALDPLGIMELIYTRAAGIGGLLSFDLEWGSGGYFFSGDHQALLVISDPVKPGLDFEFAEEMLTWLRQTTGTLLSDEELAGSSLRVVHSGSYVYAEQDRNSVESNIWLVSLISIVGVIILFLLVMKRVSKLPLLIIPLALSILWTAGLITVFPGKLNLISISFIAILVGLGIDNSLHFLNRLSEEATPLISMHEAISRTLITTGRSITWSILTTIAATIALSFSSFPALSEFGVILSIGLLMLLTHSMLTLPALAVIFWKRADEDSESQGAFRFLPWLTRQTTNIALRHRVFILATASAVALVSVLLIPQIRITGQLTVNRDSNSAALVGQELLAHHFGIEGAPETILIKGSEDDVLAKAEQLTAMLSEQIEKGVITSVLSPSYLLPSKEAQNKRAEILQEIDLNETSEILERVLDEEGFDTKQFQPVLGKLKELGAGSWQALDLDSVAGYIQDDLLSESIVRTSAGNIIVGISIINRELDASQSVLEQIVNSEEIERSPGEVSLFSYARLNREFQESAIGGSRNALLLVLPAVALLSFFCFRRVSISFYVLIPSLFASLVTLAILMLLDFSLSFVSIAALPLVIGMGIDDGIHITNRVLEADGTAIRTAVSSSGSAVIMTSLTTMIGFAALMFASFNVLFELGTVITLGVGIAMIASLLILPAVLSIAISRLRR